MIGKIERVGLREVWKLEDDFTQWLQENFDVLNEALDVNLVNAERKGSAGTFSVDIVAEDDSGNAVVIENQLEKSDHDHLGKLITYLVTMEARTAVWIVADPRPEHISAITWLNESAGANFYLLKIETMRIDSSPVAPIFTVIVGPSEEGKDRGKTKKEFAERFLLRKKFWTGLLDYAKQTTELHSSISPGQYNYISTSAGKVGLSFDYTIRRKEGQIELYIDRGKESNEENKKIFDHFSDHKHEIETDFEEPLEWHRLEDKRACRIGKKIRIGGYRDEEKSWPQIYEQMVDAMVRLEKSIRPFINELDV